MSENFVGTVASADNELQGVIENSELNINVEILAAGEKGDTGKSLEYSWNGTRLGVRQEGEINYTYVDLKGQKGDTGLPGLDGKSLEFSWNGTQLGIRVQGQSAYQYVDLKGAKGDTGATGKNLEFVWNGTQLGVRVEGEAQYQYVDLKGEKGDKGDTGNGISSIVRTSGTGAAGTTDTYTITFTNDTTTTFEVYNGADGLGAGDMIKSVYDTNNDGIVDDAEKLGGQLPEYYAKQADVTALQEDVSVNLMTAQMELSTADSIKSVTANVGSVPKVKIVAPDMLVNLLGRDGDFEVDSNSDGLADGWTKYGSTTVSSDSTNKNTGAKGQRVLQSANETGYISKPYTYIVGNKYYFRAWYYNYAIGEVLIRSQPSSLGNVAFKNSAQVGSGVISGIRTAIEGDNVVFLRNYSTANNVDTTWDSVIVVDLTQRYGAGNEPDLAWCDANIRYVNGVQPLLNPCLTVRGKNLVDEKKIVAVSSYIKPTWTGEKLLFDNSSNTAYRALVRFPVFLEKGKTYRVNRFNEVIISGSTVSFGIADSEGKSIATVYTIYTATYSGLHYLEAFTAFGSLQKIELNIQFKEGTVATAYEPYREKQRIYPCVLAKVGNYADELEDDGAVVKKIRKNKHMNLDNTLTIAYVGTVSGLGFKIIEVDCIDKSIQYNSLICEKYNGTRLSAVSNFSDKDQCYFLATALNKLRISIANTDSGYGESYNPTTDEIKAYFMGWKMNNGTFGTPYDGTGTKTWTKWNAANNTGAVTSVPTTMADGFTPYQLWYALATPEQEIIEPVGSLRLEQGYNCVDVSTGIAYERANPQLYNSGGTDYYFINIDPVPLGNLKYKNKRIVKVYRDGTDITSLCDIAAISTINGKERIRINKTDYDPNINVITVLYEVLHEDYDSQQVSVIMEYADNLRTSHNQLVENFAGLESEVNDVWFSLLPIADKEIAMQKIALLTTETTADLKSKVNEILNVWR